MVVLERIRASCSRSFDSSFSVMYIILKSFPNLSSGFPSPFSSMTSRSSVSYHTHAVGISVASEALFFLKSALTS